MDCPRCQHENPPLAKFCLECGSRLAPTCAQCGTALPAGAKFCLECGQPVGAPPGRSPSPDAYTPKHLAEKILTSKSALEGERKQVTVLFADLKGSMELLADRDPEEARKLLDPVLERMMEAVHRYEGTVNQVMGDGIMALFGAPVAHEDHAVRACYAALRMQEAVKRYAADVQRAQGLPLHIRVGLNSGPVVVRSIGSDLRMDYTAVGQTTHLAARMEQTAMPGSILMTAETLRAAEGYVQVRALGPVHIKGLADPVEAFEVTGAGLVRTRLQAATTRGLTRFVGRESELDHLRQALERARAGHGQVVALVGEPGVGKSRLVLEFTHSHRTEGWLRLEASSVSYGKATPYLPVVDLLKAYFQIEAGDEGRRVREKITGKLLTLDRALEPALPAVLALLDVLGDDASWQALDPPQRRQRTLDAVKRLLLRESQVQPLLLVFEDLHWIDSEAQAFLDVLVESLPTARLLLLVNYRPEYQHGWGSRTAYSQLRLDPLPPETAGELLQALLGDDRTLEPVARLLIARTEGNPFFLEESVRTLVETKALVGERGAYRVVTPLHDLQVPATVEAILAARIDRLPAEDKRLLQVAAVIGKDVSFGLLQAVADLPEDDLERGLARLQAAEFLYESSLFPEREYTFKHALTHEVAYRGLLQDRRRAIHAKLVGTLERLGGDRSTEQIEQLAHHAFRSEAWDKAVTYLRQAGGKATERSAYAEAVARFEQALEALGHLPESPERLAEAIDLRLNLHGALYPLGELERTLAHLREAESAAEALGDQPRLGLVSAHLTFCHSWVGDRDRAVASGERALAIASTLKDVTLRVVASGRLGQAYFDAGEFRRAVELFRSNVERLEGDLVHDRFGGLAFIASVFSRGYLARCLATLGDFVSARASIEKGVGVAEAAHHPYSITVAYWLAAMPLLLQGDFPKAISWLERCQDLCRRENTPLLFWIVTRLLGEAYARSERLAEGLPLLEQAAEQLGTMKSMRWYPGTVSALSTAYLLAGRLADALQSVRRALQLSHAHKQPGVEAEALRVLGDIQAGHAPPDVEAADAAYRQALALAEPRGMRPLAAHCHLGLGKLYRRAGDGIKAQEHMTIAATMYREMGMGFWQQQAEAAITDVG
jgi:class 3 adenylate cyclase/tetratricopeptide (TPR) repeat protein